MPKTRHQVAQPIPCTGLRPRPVPLHRQRGVFAVMTAALILVILGVCGLAIDLGRMYNRKVELQNVADTIALAAAAELDGTQEGVGRALTAAAEAAGRNPLYDYSSSFFAWSDNAIRFGTAPAGSAWLNASEAKDQARDLFYVEVDTDRLGEAHGHVGTLLLQVLPSTTTTPRTRGRAVAGRSSVNVMPLAICAISETAGAPRGTELLEYGFRRGISYNLMQLNPKEKSPARHFLINPFAPPGTSGGSVKSKLDAIEPFVCTGTMAMPRLTGKDITVEHGFPLADVYRQFNSRFASYTAPCTSAGAPPDTNIKEYTVSDTSNEITWMNDKPAGQSAVSKTSDSQMLTAADLPSDPLAPTTAADYGPLWIYAKAAKYLSYKEGEPEPPGGYSTFTANNTDWGTLYSPGSPKTKGTYPSPVPAKASGHTLAPTGVKGVADRRILNIPLLSCPVASGSPAPATVLAIAKFYMTVKATENKLIGEFAGIAREAALVGPVELYP